MRVQPEAPAARLNNIMKPSRLVAALLAALLLVCACPALAQISAYRFDPARVPVGQVLHFAKSQPDGSNAAHLSVYVATPEHIESFKWHEGADQATLVTAEMGWKTFSVRRFESWRLSRAAAPQLRGELEVVGDQLRTTFMDTPLRLHQQPFTASQWETFKRRAIGAQ